LQDYRIRVGFLSHSDGGVLNRVRRNRSVDVCARGVIASDAMKQRQRVRGGPPVVPAFGWRPFLVASGSILLGTLLGSGAVWQYMDHQVETVKLEKDLYAQLGALNGEILAEIPKYAYERDEYFVAQAERAPGRSHRPSEEAAHANAYNRLRQKLIVLIKQYNRLEAKLAKLEGRPAQWMVVPLPPLPPTNMTTREIRGGRYVVCWKNPQIDPLIIEVRDDVQALSGTPWHMPNESLLVGISFIARRAP